MEFAKSRGFGQTYQDQEIKRLEYQNKKLNQDGWIMFAMLMIFMAMLLVASVLSSIDFTKYYYIATKTQIVELTRTDIIAYCYYDDGLDRLTFKGKYDGEHALVTINLVYTEYDTLSNGDTLYQLDIYAISTIKTDYFYRAYSEEIDTIYTSHY